MSIKAMSLVWELECPAEWNGLRFTSSHKFVLLAYADHADHEGKSMYPAIRTIRNKTGYATERQIQRITHQLEKMGMLLPDGIGPRGTHRWMLPFDEGGVKITPPQILQGDIYDKSLGDIPLGDIPLGVKITPELKEPELNTSILNKNYLILVQAGETIFDAQSHQWREIRDTLEHCKISQKQGRIIVKGIGADAEKYQERYARSFERALIGILKKEVQVTFRK